MAETIPEIQTSTATERVLETVELLESILLNLDTDTAEGLKILLLSQKVNRMFRNTIAGSSKLQVALWFKSTDAIEQNNTPQVNPLFDIDANPGPGLRWYKNQPLGPWHPIYFPYPGKLDCHGIEITRGFSELLEGSWRKMLMSRGSCEVREVIALRHETRAIPGQSGKFFNTGALRKGLPMTGSRVAEL